MERPGVDLEDPPGRQLEEQGVARDLLRHGRPDQQSPERVGPGAGRDQPLEDAGPQRRERGKRQLIEDAGPQRPGGRRFVSDDGTMISTASL